jgi:outer membrane protein TolC
MKRTLAAILTLALYSATPAGADDTLSSQKYLEQVRTQNEEIKGAIAASEAAMKRSEAGQLATAFTLFAETEYARDAALPLLPFVTYESIEQQRALLGIKKTTTFGLEGKVYYLLRKTHYLNQGAGALPQINWFDSRPTLELTQSLWSNGFGRTTRATLEASEAASRAASFSQRYKAKSLLAAAEQAYWRLALAQERVEVASSALEQSKKIVAWSQDKYRRNLIDEVDLLQTKAAMEVRQLELQGAREEARAAARVFNRFMNIPSDEVSAKLDRLTNETLAQPQNADTKLERDDVKAAEEQQRAAIAQAAASIESTRPVLDVYGSYALNGRDTNAGGALGNPFDANRHAFSVGLKFAMPLDRGLASNTMDGWRTEQMAAEMTYRQKLNDLRQDWDELARRIGDLRTRLKLNQGLVAAQKAKLERERERLNTGRTTTFQVLSFEQDYAQSRIAEINVKSELIHALTQLKLYGEAI